MKTRAQMHLGASLILVTILTGCATLKPWDRTLLNDPEVQPTVQPMEKYSIGIETYREGSVGGSGAQTSGGCGCY